MGVFGHVFIIVKADEIAVTDLFIGNYRGQNQSNVNQKDKQFFRVFAPHNTFH